MNTKVFYNLTDDILFKNIFYHKNLTIDLLNSFFRYINEDKTVLDVRISKDYSNYGNNRNHKIHYCDIIAYLSTGEIVSIEMYTTFTKEEFNKSVSYLSRLYGNQLKKGEEYSKVKKVVGITLYNKKIRLKMDEVLEEYKLTEQITRVKTNDEMTLFLIDIDKLANFTYNKCERLREYAKLLKKRWLSEMEEFIKDKEDDEMFQETVAYVKEFLNDPKNHDVLDHHASDVANAKIEGYDEGHNVGYDQAKKSISKNLINAGIDKETVAKCTNLSISELNKLLVNN